MERGPLSTTDPPGVEEGALNYCGFCVIISAKEITRSLPSFSLMDADRIHATRRQTRSSKNIVVRPEWICLWWIAAAQAPSTAEASIAVPFDRARLAPAFAPPSAICTTSAAAGLTADRSTRRLHKPLVPTDPFLNMPSAEWISGPTNRRQAAFFQPDPEPLRRSSPAGSFRFCPPRVPFAGLAGPGGTFKPFGFRALFWIPRRVRVHGSRVTAVQLR
jgi:hypothetical protein